MGNLTTFRTAFAEGGTWADMAKLIEIQLSDLAPPGSGMAHLGFLYVTAPVGEGLSSILTFLRQKLGIEEWVGAIGYGICLNEHEIFARPGAAVMIMTLPENTFSIVPGIKSGMDEIPEGVRAWMKLAMPPFGVVHGDPTNHRIAELIDALSLKVENLTLEIPGFLVGGLTAAQGSGFQVAGTLTGGGVSGVLFTPEIEVATGLSQGCQPVGSTHQITECMDNVIMALDERPALDVFKEDIGELLARDLARVDGYIHAAFPVEGSDTGDYTVRNLMGIDVERDWLAVAQSCHNGERVLFVRRDPKSAENDLRDMVGNLLKRLPGPPRAALYFSCVARGPSLFGKEGFETALIREMLGDVPLIGFFGNGEISNNRLHGYTGVLTLFV